MTDVTLQDVLVDAGVTYRQLDYWTRRGYLKPEIARAGSGHPREWPEGEIQVARLMLRLVDGGLAVSRAAAVAREVVLEGASFVRLGEGLTLDVEVQR